jgi:hypothetical protein
MLYPTNHQERVTEGFDNIQVFRSIQWEESTWEFGNWKEILKKVTFPVPRHEGVWGSSFITPFIFYLATRWK